MRALLPLLLCVTLSGQERPPDPVRELAMKVESSRLRRSVDRLASFGTRHTLSAGGDRRGIGAARRWLAGEMAVLAGQGGSRLQVVQDAWTAGPGPRLPRAVELANLALVLPGAEPVRAQEAIVLTAHYDSRGSRPEDADGDAPGAVDNASGVALLLELANLMAQARPAVSVHFVATAGGEQGLLGAARLVQRLKDGGVTVRAMLALEGVGNTTGADGHKESGTVRLFSEGVPMAERDEARLLREALGGENDAPGRELARYLKRMGERHLDEMEALVLLRRDRIGRGSDALMFQREGVPAVLVRQGLDNPDRQQQTPRVEGRRSFGDTPAWFDAGYGARVGRLLLASLWHLAHAPEPPRGVVLIAGGADARLAWAPPTDPRAVSVVVYRRRADAVQWQDARVFAKDEPAVLQGTSADSYVFAVATVDAQGNESLAVGPSHLQ